MPDPRPLLAFTGPWTDNVARWQQLQQEYPQAVYTSDRGWFYGALRDQDEVLRAADLGQLITRLLTRER